MCKLYFGLVLMLVLPAWSAEIKIDFSNFPTNESPEGFHSALAGVGQPGDWKIVMDEIPSAFAPLTPQARQTPILTRRAVLAQISQELNEERFPMLVYEKEMFKDFKLTTRFKIVSGLAEQMAGVVFRYQNSSNFYVVRASALGHNIRFYKVVDGARGNFFGPDMDISTNVWHTLAVQCQGNQFMFWYDGQPVMPPLNDNTFSEGKIGFWTMSDAVSYFGDTTIAYTPRVPMAQSLVDGMMQKYSRILKLRVYTLDDKGEPQIIASNDKKEIGEPGTDAEKSAIVNGAVYFGRGKGTVAVTMPLTDRNGNPVAAVRVELRSFFGETQDTAVTRARVIVDKMQAQVLSRQDLTQ
ncbi:MAG TPA: family 16 glycoside hydrolase [Candidatus Saccharimonadales bacterium]|nr:family 16 glycoside hydrolase [Candidatus Saccharimonadales bacterium]